MIRWWSQLRRLHQVAFAHPRDRADGAARPHRRADWPVCPQCGEDELMSTVSCWEAGQVQHPQPSDPMRCLNCGWRGVVLTSTSTSEGE